MAGLNHIWKVCVAVAISMQQASLLFGSLQNRGKDWCWDRRGDATGMGKVGRPTHTLNHHGATPVWGLSPRYLLDVMNHHGADTVCVSIAAVGERKVALQILPATPKCHRK